MKKNHILCSVVLAIIFGFFNDIAFNKFFFSDTVFAQEKPSVVELKWTDINHDSGSSMDRAMIPGGWIVRAGRGNSITFVPDPKHQWE